MYIFLSDESLTSKMEISSQVVRVHLRIAGKLNTCICIGLAFRMGN